MDGNAKNFGWFQKTRGNAKLKSNRNYENSLLDLCRGNFLMCLYKKKVDRVLIKIGANFYGQEDYFDYWAATY